MDAASDSESLDWELAGCRGYRIRPDLQATLEFAVFDQGCAKQKNFQSGHQFSHEKYTGINDVSVDSSIRAILPISA